MAASVEERRFLLFSALTSCVDEELTLRPLIECGFRKCGLVLKVETLLCRTTVLF